MTHQLKFTVIPPIRFAESKPNQGICCFIARIVLMTFFAPAAVSACQVSCLEFAVKSVQGRLLAFEGTPIARAQLIVREAGEAAKGPKAICGGKKGPIVKRAKTGKNGNFKIDGLKPGEYWVTYSDAEQGESFLLRVDRKEGMETIGLTINSWGGRCYLFDIERNVTKPDGWPLPV